jgi:hypothetical protein
MRYEEKSFATYMTDNPGVKDFSLSFEMTSPFIKNFKTA